MDVETKIGTGFKGPPIQERFSLKEIFSIFLDLDRENIPEKISPSCFVREMQMSTEQRYKKLVNPLRKLNFEKELCQTEIYFKINPNIVVFQKCQIGETYNIRLSVCNSSKILTPLRMTCEDSPYFKVNYASPKVITRLAPGMSVYFDVKFTPEEERDYKHQITFLTDKTSFTVPVYAIGPRPLLDFPDAVHFPKTSVKVPAIKMLMVSNIGEVTAVFSLTAERPFTVQPSKCVLAVGEVMQVNISFDSIKTGNYTGSLNINFVTGEKLVTSLHGMAENANIMLSKETVHIEDTYMGLKRQTTMTLHNNSDHIVHFKWGKYQSREEEGLQMDKLKDVFEVVKTIETEKTVHLEMNNVISKECHTTLYDRIYQDEVKALDCEEFLFSSRHFSLIPLTGEVWPNAFVDVTIVFNPDGAKDFQTKTYCDVTGLEDRLPLIITGRGLGPLIELNLASLDMSLIYLCSVHSYEVIAHNKGDIPGTIVFIEKPLVFGGKVECTPRRYMLVPGDYQVFVLNFSSAKEGDFFEDICFRIEESQEVVSFGLKGKIVTPTLHFSRKSLDWGEVPIGFATKHHIVLFNLSLVPVTFSLRVMHDGTENSVTYREFAKMAVKKALPMSPREFKIKPAEGVVAACSSIRVKLTLVPNLPRMWSTAIVVDMWEASCESVKLPLKYHSMVPRIICHPEEISIRFCFINHPYTRKLMLENCSNIDGFFYFVPQKETDHTTMTYSPSVREGIIKRNSKIYINFTIMTNTLGLQSVPIRLLVLGDRTPTSVCRVVCNGQGPVIAVTPHRMDWGKTILLEPTTQELILTNDSPIPAFYHAIIAKANSAWKVFPEKSVLNPEQTLSLDVTVFLTDTGLYSDNLEVHISNSRTITIHMTAEGYGTSIVVEPPITPIYDVGYLFSTQKVRKELKVTNRGQRHHQLLWTSTRTTRNISKVALEKYSQGIFFKLSPTKMNLGAGENAILLVEGGCQSPQTVREEFFCFAIIEYVGKKQCILTSRVVAHFIEPLVITSKPQLNFRIDVQSEKDFVTLQENVEMNNLSELPLTIDFQSDFPFLIVDKEGQLATKCIKHLDRKSSTIVTVSFDPSYTTGLYSRLTLGYLHYQFKEHPQTGVLPLRGEVNFPNIKLLPNVIDFGCVPIGTNVYKEFFVRNISPLPIDYEWSITDYEINLMPQDEKSTGNESKRWDEGLAPNQDKFSAEITSPDGQQEALIRVTIPEPDAESGHVLSGELLVPVAKNSVKGQDIMVDTVSTDVLKHRLFPLVSHFFVGETEMAALETLAKIFKAPHQVQKYFGLIPFYGHLPPFDSQIVSLEFRGNVYMKAKICAMIKFQGGPSEILEVTAEVGSIKYHIDKTLINFGMQMFGTNCPEVITLTNNGQIDFDLTINYDNKPVAPGKSWFTVEPRVSHVVANTELPITVTFNPGVSGKYIGKFYLEIGYLNPITVQIEGKGVIPKVSLNLPRLMVSNFPVKFGYAAITNMTSYWLPTKHWNNLDNPTYTLPEVKMLESESKELKKQNWVVVSTMDHIPSVVEINLAIERVLAEEHLKNNPNISLHYNGIKMMSSIPEFRVPPYLIDFGLVIVDTEVHQNVTLTNHGPGLVMINLCKPDRKNSFKNLGFEVVFENIVDLPVGGFVTLFVKFLPLRRRYQTQQTNMDVTAWLEVIHGALIPINIRAIVTVPFISVSTHTVDFQMVKCGQKKLFPIILSNEGLVTCKWKAHLKYEEKKRKTSHMMLRTDKESSTEIIKPEFSINKTSGIITPKEKEIFDIFYQPNKPGHHEVELIFNLFQNNDRVTVLLQGEAEEPVLNISDPDICFDPVLPFPQDYEVCFTIENPCTFPIEFLFPDSDSQLSEEERILRVVSHFYKTEELLLPERSPGDKLPNELFDFYQTLIDEVSVKMLLQLYKDIDDHSKMANEVIEEKKLRKKITPRLHSTFSRHSTAVTADTGKAAPSLPIDPLHNKEPEEIEALLHEHIDEIHSSPECRNLRYDPIQAAMTASLASGFPVRESISKDGVLIVFHGAPLTEHVYAAHKTAKCLQLTPLKIDQMILEIAATGYTMPAMKVRDHLNTIYLDELNHMLAENEDPTQQMLHPQDKEDRMQDPLEELTNKVMFLDIYWHMRPGKTTDTTETLSSRPMKKLDVSHSLVRGGSGSQPSSQHSNRHPTSKKSPYIEDPLALHGTLANTPFDLLVELLRQRSLFPDCKQGMVIESLNSVFFPAPSTAMNALLRAVGNIKYIQCIVFLNSFDQHIECLRRNKEQNVEKKKADYEAKLKKLETLSDDKLDDLNEEDFRLYTKINLEKRRQKFKLKKEEKQRALHEKYQKEMLRKSRIQKQQQQSKKHSKKGTTKSSEEGPRKPRVLGRTTSVMEANTTGLTSVDAGDKKRSRSALRLDERRKSRYKTSTKHDNDFIKKNSKIKLLGENFSPALSKEFSLHTEHPSELQLKFEAFQNDFEELIPLLENWDRKKGMIMNTILERVTPLISHTKKGTRRSKRLSDSHTHPRLTTPSIDMQDLSPEDGKLEKLVRGVSLWIMDWKHPEFLNLDTIINLLKEKTDVQDVIADMLKCPELPPLREITYSYVLIPKLRQKTSHSDLFPLKPTGDGFELDQPVQNDQSEDSLDVQDRTGSGTVKGRGQKKKVKSLKKHSQDNVLSTPNKKERKSGGSIVEVPALAKLRSRWLLQPGEKMDWKMRFEPREVGGFSHTYVLELVSTNRQYTVTGHGNCVLPFFNTAPTAIFSQVSESVPEDRNYTCTYFIDKEAFDFGSVVTSKPKEKRVHQVVTNFKFENISLLPAMIEFTFAEKTVDKVDGFRIEPSTLLVQPGETQLLTVYANPHMLGTVSDELVCSIKNNPKIEIIKMICNGVKIEFEIDTRNISFDHTLLHHKDVKTLNLINKCPIPLVWKFFGVDTLKEEFEISLIEGFLGPHDKKEVKFTHLASRVQVISKKPLKLEVFIEEGLMEPVFSEIIYLSAETFDVSVDVQFAQSDVNQVDFGKILVGHESKQTLTLKNRGKYEITFKAVISNDPSVNVSNIEDLIKLNTFAGTLAHGEKPFIIQVIANPETELEISSVPLLKFSIFHSQYKNTIVAVIPVRISLTSLYARFKILPVPDINFGPMIVGSKKTLELIIQNIGIFEFKYTIVKTTKDSSYEVKSQLLDGSAPIKKGKGMEKSESKVTFPKLSARGNRRLDTNSLSAGPFTLSNLTGLVDPGQMVVLLVECCPETLGSFHEEIVINVSDCHPDFKRGTSIQLLSQGFMPTVDYTNFDDIFKEHYICDSLASFHCKVEAGSHCVFIKDEGKLLFRNVCVGTKFPARLRLYNPTLVPCTLYLSTTTATTKGAKSTESAFSVTPPKLTVSPYTTETLTVNFAPTLMEMYSASFEIFIEMPAPVKPVKIIFKLAGEGCIPEVTIVLPNEKGRHGHKLLSFCPTILGDVTTRQFSFTNVGVLPCKVIVELYLNTGSVFSLYPTHETVPKALMLIPNEPVQYTTIVCLNPGQFATFDVHFQPQHISTYEGEVKLFIVDNPFENLSITLTGEGYMEDITLEGLFPERLSHKSLTQKQEGDFELPCYQLDYGFCYINKIQKRNFKMANHSDMNTYRFEWKPHPNIVISPTIGHLLPKIGKDIVITFLASEPLTLTKLELQCTIAHINLLTPNLGTTAWDDRQKVMSWRKETNPANSDAGSFNSFMSPELSIAKLQEYKLKVVEMEDEPDHEIISGTVRSFSLLVSAVADYTKCSYSTYHIHFKDTLMFQNCVCEFTHTNTGLVPLEYKWIISVDESLPIRPSSAALLRSMELADEGLSHRSTFSRPMSALLPPKEQLFRDTSCEHVATAWKRPRSLTGRETLLNTSAPGSDLFSRAAELSDRSNDSWAENDYLPFRVEPEGGLLGPEECVIVKVIFSPLDVFDYKAKLSCIIPNLHPEQKPAEIVIKARSLMPYCHFDVEESDYLSIGRRDPCLGGVGFNQPLDPHTKVLEFNVMGVGVTTTKKFNIINPTEQNYSFSWRCDSVVTKGAVQPFHCPSLDGWVESGKQTEIQFSFTAQDVGLFESFWTFCILEHDIETPFLLLGVVTEPSVGFVTSHVNLTPTLKGIKTSKQVSLNNNEDVDMSFSFDPNSLFSDGHLEHLSINPASGILPAHSEQPIEIEFVPSSPGETLFHLKCVVKKLKAPLMVSVLALCYNVQPLVSWEDMLQRKWTLDPTQANTINFGSVPPKTPQTIMFVLTNIGKTSFYYQLKYDEEMSRKLGIKLDFSERGGHVTSQSRTSTTLTLTLLKKSFVKNFELILEISRGPKYKMLLQGEATLPQFQFSFYEYDFGSCLLQQSDVCHYKKELTFYNNDVSPMVLECLYENKPHLKITLRSDPIPPEGSTLIPIFFYPLARLKYSETLHFIINGFQEKKIIITGEGVDIKVFLVQPRHKLLSFGALQVGHIASKCVPIVNKSKAPVPMLLTVVDPPSVLPTSSANKLTEVLHITPKTLVVIQPNETISVTVKFTPNRRIKPFSEKLYMQIHENVEPLCLMTGSCVGSEFQLDRKYLPFGMVVQGCQSSLKLLLSNTGELGSRFCWSRDNCDNLFSITPSSGYLSPGVTITFIVDFHPINLQQNIRCDMECKLENFKPLVVSLTGSCVSMPSPREILNFTTVVRQQDKKNIVLTNKSGETWQLFPEMSGDYFLGQDTIQVVPHSVKLYEVTYTPLTMTEHDNKHMGSVFFRLPEGQGLLYSLVGTAEPPVAVARISKEVPSKTPHIEILPVFNWLPVAQRFKVTTNLIKSEKFDPVFTLTGNDYIDVPGNSDRDHRLTFFSYKECSLIFKVSFTNEDSGEYQFYDLALRVFKCGSLDTFTMETCVRKPITFELKLKNPLNSVVNFNISCPASDVQVPTPNSVPAKTMKYVTLEYLPLHPGENHVRLDVQCSELGFFPYELVLDALPAPKENPLIFNTSLGIAVSLEAQFNNLAHTKADFGCKVDHNDFHVDKSVLVAPAHTGSVEVTYEPSSLGSVHALLTITSTTGGEFIFPLIGKSTLPKPQGPIVLKPGTGTTIPFKNVFRETKTFMLSLDCPSFVLKNNSETIKSKKEHKLHIGLLSLKSMEITDMRFPVTGKLVVLCTDPTLSHISWTYYLKGILE